MDVQMKSLYKKVAKIKQNVNLRKFHDVNKQKESSKEKD